ncbi:baseplate assembly protein [Pseudomonas sp. v388]|uniref:GPW/gp25 family protein n=1 Tax=Pseudomonas sp. v388 TaxID=2479849 RepID=UPI000F7A3DA7|nr:GPW/gp25 family protein [Pseudomonas sp. v388]RRV04437.1 baseplate assembly protein [Pseudomonas sp. v388]
MNRVTGGALTRREHIAQSITDILTTRIGTRVMRRDYGSLLPDLIDAPFNDLTRLRIYAATTLAVLRWEPRVRLSQVNLVGADLQGASVLNLYGEVIDSYEPLNLSIPLQLGGSV